VTRFLPIIHALLETSRGSTTLESEGYNWASFVPQLAAIIADQDALPLSRSRSQYCLMNILLASKAQMSGCLRILATEVKSLSKRKPTRELLVLAIWLERQFDSEANEVVSEVLDAGLWSSIDCMTDGTGDVSLGEFLQLLGKNIYFSTSRCLFTRFRSASLVASASRAKPHVVETVLSVIIQHRLSNSAALQLAISSISSCHLKVNLVFMIQLEPTLFEFTSAASSGQSSPAEYTPASAFLQAMFKPNLG
jgi:hypothetical protein